jgi:23S rRNA (pseudouridine1915-N3)-methyltransferase
VKVFVYYIGRPKDPHLNALAEDYLSRVARYTTAQMTEVRVERTNIWAKHPTARKVFLDPAGQRLDSAGFVALVGKAELDARDLLFLIGGHDGLPGAWRAYADLLLSLSPLTMPHELARVVLNEQIYRAFATLRGHPYPR